LSAEAQQKAEQFGKVDAPQGKMLGERGHGRVVRGGRGLGGRGRGEGWSVMQD